MTKCVFCVKFGNTCYVNSVLQALYFCKPFREKIIQYKLAHGNRLASLASSAKYAPTLATTSSPSSHINEMSSTGESASGGGDDNTPSTSASSSGASTRPPAQSMLKQEHLLNCLAELFYSIVTMKKKKGIVQPKKFIARLRKDNGTLNNKQNKKLFS